MSKKDKSKKESSKQEEKENSKTTKKKRTKKTKSKNRGLANLFFLLAPFIGLIMGYFYIKNKEKVNQNPEKSEIYQEHQLTDKEIIKLLELKLEEGNNDVSKWIEEKINNKDEFKLDKQKKN